LTQKKLAHGRGGACINELNSVRREKAAARQALTSTAPWRKRGQKKKPAPRGTDGEEAKRGTHANSLSTRPNTGRRTRVLTVETDHGKREMKKSDR